MRFSSFSTLIVGMAVLALALAPSAGLADNGPYELPDTSMTCYKGKQNKNTAKLPKGISETLNDAFHDNDYDVKKIGGLCIPASVNGGQSTAATSVSWKIKGAKGSPKATPQSGVRAFNGLGDVSLDTKKEAGALLSTSGGLKCWKAKVTKGTPKFPKGIQVTVSDSINSSTRTFDVKKPALICNTTGTEAAQPIATICYKAKATKGEAKDVGASMIEVTDSVLAIESLTGNTKVDLKKIATVCVSALRSPPNEFCGDGAVNQSEGCDGDSSCTTGNLCPANCGGCTTCDNGSLDTGEVCDSNSDCAGIESCVNNCTACETNPAFGQRAFTIDGASSDFLTSFISVPVGNIEGTLTFDAGPINNNDGTVAVTTGGPQYLRTNQSVGGLFAICTELDCAGTLYCQGGVNVDVQETLDSLAADQTECVQGGAVVDGLGTGSLVACGDGESCCANACQAREWLNWPTISYQPTSGNPDIVDFGVGSADSGVGALAMACTARILQDQWVGSDCSTLDYSNAPVRPHGLTTGYATGNVINHCAGTGAPPEVAVGFSIGPGVNFDCDNWTVSDGPGTIGYVLNSEQPTPLIGGDGANGLILTD